MSTLVPVLMILFGLLLLASLGSMVVRSLRTGRSFLSQDPRQSRAGSPVTYRVSLVLVSLVLGRVGVGMIEGELAELLAK